MPESLTLALVGDSGVGKTTFLAEAEHHMRFSYGRPDSERTGFLRHLEMHTNFGPIRFRCWDGVGSGTPEGAVVPAQGAIVMFDLTSRLSLRSIPRWVHVVRSVQPHIPIVVVGNKADAPARFAVTTEDIEALCGEHFEYMEVSSMPDDSNTVTNVFVWFARLFAEDDNVVIAIGDAFGFEITMTAEQIALLEAENARAVAAGSLPEEDDDL